MGDKDFIAAELEFKVTTCTSLADINSPMALEPEMSPPTVKKAKGLGAILSKLPTEEVSTEVSTTEKFDQPYANADSNPLLWWRSNSSLFPLLSNLAKKYLSVPGISVLSERIFSKGGNIVDPFRSHLKPDNVNILIFLSKNMK